MKQMKRSETRDMSIFGKKNEKSITAKERDREREAKEKPKKKEKIKK